MPSRARLAASSIGTDRAAGYAATLRGADPGQEREGEQGEGHLTGERAQGQQKARQAARAEAGGDGRAECDDERGADGAGSGAPVFHQRPREGEDEGHGSDHGADHGGGRRAGWLRRGRG
ncbi:hypothetical protein GCM10020295_80920 [Streptomyces cinereospinus]